MQSILSKIKLATQASGRPPAAVEIAPEGVLAAALPGRGQTPVYAYQPLAPGAVVPGIVDPNLRAVDAVTTAIRSTLEQVSPRTRAVTLILPDAAVRVFVLDFDTLPEKDEETDPVVRFRLRKMLPFEVEDSALSYQILSRSKEQVKLLIAVIPGAILQEYETAVQAAGFETGAALPSTLAALAGVQSMEAMLTANLSGQTLTTSIANGNDLLLYRTLDLPEDPALRLQELQRDVAVATAYFEDKLQAKPRGVLYSGYGGAEQFARWIDNPELPVSDMAPRPETGAVTPMGEMSIAGVAGALAEAS